MKRFTVLLLVVLAVLSPTTALAGGSCVVTPPVVPMESSYTISVSGLAPNANYSITIRQTGNGSYTKGIGSHPNAGVITGPDGSGSSTLVAYGIDTYDNPRLVLNPDAGAVHVHVEPASWDDSARGQANCSFEVT